MNNDTLTTIKLYAIVNDIELFKGIEPPPYKRNQS